MKLKRYIIATLIVLVCVLPVIRINQIQRTELINTGGRTFEKGIVTQILEDNVQEDGTHSGEQTVKVRMLGGIRKGEELVTTSSSGLLFGAVCTVGMKVIVIQSVAGDDTITSVYSRDRGTEIIIFACIYLLMLCVIGGKQGIRSSASLIFTFISIRYIYIPFVYAGFSPFLSAVIICILATAVTFACISGINMKSLIASAGTMAGVIIAGAAAEIFSAVTGITGWNVSDIENLMTLYDTNNIQVGGLLFSGLLISSLGAVMDVAMSVSSSMQEICRQNKEISRRELFCAGMRVGRDMMGTDSNTLILAFAGSGISMLVLDYAYALPYLQMINSNNIGIAVMQGLSGSFGIILSLPVTVALASVCYRNPIHK